MKIIPRHKFYFKFLWLWDYLLNSKTYKNTIYKKVKSFFISYFYAYDIYFFSSARAAFYFLITNLNLSKESEILIPKHRFYIYEKIVTALNIKIKLVPVNKNLLIDPEKIKNYISNNTKIIIALHLYSRSSDIEKLKEICEARNIILIEDIAHAFGSYYNGKPLGSFGDFSLLSFGTGKHLVAFGGGALIINNNKYDFLNSYKKLHICGKRVYMLDFIKGLMEFVFTSFPIYNFLVYPIFFILTVLGKRDLLENLFFENENEFKIPTIKKLDHFRMFLLKKQIEYFKTSESLKKIIFEKLKKILKQKKLLIEESDKLNPNYLFYQTFMDNKKSDFLLKQGIDNRFDYCFGVKLKDNTKSIYLPIYPEMNLAQINHYINTLQKL